MGPERDSEASEPPPDPESIVSGPSAPGFGTPLHEEQLRLVFESMNQGIVFQSADGQITSWNPAAERILGLSSDELGSRTSMDPEWHAIKEDGTLFPGNEHPSMRALATGLPVTDVTMGLHNPVWGETRWIIVSAVPLFEQGAFEPREVFASFTDVTELTLSQDELAESQHFATSILDLSPNLIYIYDLLESRNVYANREVTTFLGYTAEEVLALGSELFARILHPDDAAVVAQHHARLVGAADGEVFSVDYRMKHADGEWRWLRSRDVPFARSASDLVTQILGATEDMTHEKRTEVALRDSEARYRSIFDDSPVAIWEEDFSEVKLRFDRLRITGVTDFRSYFEDNPDELGALAAKVRILAINKRSVELLGAQSAEELARELPRYFTAESFPVFADEMVALANGERSFRAEIPILSHNKERLLLDLRLTVPPEYADDLSRVIVSFFDITERKNAEIDDLGRPRTVVVRDQSDRTAGP